MSTTYCIDLGDKADDLELANLLLTCSKSHLNNLSNVTDNPVIRDILLDLIKKYTVKQKSTMDRTLYNYIGKLNINSRNFTYYFSFDERLLKVTSDDEYVLSELRNLGFRLYTKSKEITTHSMKLCKELHVDEFTFLYDAIYQCNTSACVVNRILDGSITIDDDKKLYAIYKKYIESMVAMKQSNYIICRKVHHKYPSIIKVDSVNMDVYNTKIVIDVEVQYENDLKVLYDDGWEIDNRDRAYRSKYIKFEDMLDIVYRDKFNLTESTSMVALPMTFQVTEDCNLCCSYCFQINKSHKSMNLETAKKVIDYLLTRTDENTSYFKPSIKPFILIEFVGGEGLLEIELIDKILDYFLQRALELDHIWAYHWNAYISTNGVLYRDPKVQRILDKWKGMLSVTITVDGSKELHDMCRVFPDGSGSYDLAMDALMDQFNRNGCPSTKITLSPENIPYFKDSIIDIMEKGFKHIWYNGIFEHEWTVEEARSVYLDLRGIVDWIFDRNLQDDINIIRFSEDMFKPMPESENKNYCGGDGNMLSVNPDGEFFNCYRYMATSLNGEQKPLRIGDVNIGIGNCDSDIENITEMKSITRRSQCTDECYYCPVAFGCAWCSAYNYQKYGTCNKRTTGICNLHKAETLGNIYYWNRVYKAKGDTRRLDYYFDYDFVKDIITEEEFKNLVE